MNLKRALPPLRLTPYAWAKLVYLRDVGATEVGGFGISAAKDLLCVEDVRLVRQWCTPVTVRLDDEAVADHFDEQVDRGLQPEQFGRIWIHTHPGHSAQPSPTDERTFARCFVASDWAVMLIVACGGQTYARLRFRAGPGGALEVPVQVDYSQPFLGSDHAGWDADYASHVFPEALLPEPAFCRPGHAGFFSDPLAEPCDEESLFSYREARHERRGYPF